MARIRGNKFGGNGGRNDSANNNSSQKRHQRQRGYPDADAKIIALTPDELTDDRLFVCTVCNEVFVREQNLILHVRTHSVPSKLKKNSDDDGSSNRKLAFVCPIITCRHHNPERALSDITGIKKHYGRAHGEKKWACTLCPKAYGVEADLKAHSKLHLKDVGARSSKRAVSDRHKGHEGSANSDEEEEDDISEEEETAVAAAAAANDNGHADNDNITLAVGAGEEQEVYVPQFDVAPDLEEREQERVTANGRALLDFDDLELLGSLPMGLTGLLTGCTAQPEAPVPAANSAPLGALFAPIAATPTPPTLGGPEAAKSPQESAIPTIDLNLSISSYGDHQSSNALNYGAGMLQNLSSEGQYHASRSPASGQESPAAEAVQGVVNTGPNASIMTPALLSNADGLQMPHMMTIPSMGSSYYFPAGALSQQAMNTPNPSSSSFAPFLGGFSGLNQGSELVSNGAGGFFLVTPSSSAPQGSRGCYYPSMPGVNGAGAAAATSNMNQDWFGLQTGYAAPPPAAPGSVDRGGNGSGYGATMDLDLNF